MAFFLLAVAFLASFLIGALFRPKIRDTSKPASLKDFDIPTADASRSIPTIFGTVLLDQPNITWYGDLQSVKLEEKIKTGPFSSTKRTLIYRYSMGIQFALCNGPIDKLHQVRTEDKVAFSGNVKSTNGLAVAFTVDSKEIYGGDWRDQLEAGGEGGVYAVCDLLPGSDNQAANSYMQTVLGINLPAYRDVCYVMWQGPTSGQFVYPAGRNEPILSGWVGDSPNLKPFSFVVQRCPKALAIYNGEDVDPDATLPASCYLNRTAEGTSDANPVEVIYELLTNDRFGAGIPTSLIDIDSFLNASVYIAEQENLVFSAVWDSPREVRELIDDILAYIDGLIFTDPITGLITINLVRPSDTWPYNYSETYGSTFTKDDIVEVTSFSRQAWDESINEVRLNYTDRFDLRDGVRTYRDKSAIQQDAANRRIQGATVSTNVSYLGISGATTAANIARRDLRNLTIPLGKISFRTRRLITYEALINSVLVLRSLVPGDLILINHPDIGGSYWFRIIRIAYGELENGVCEIDAIQDVFRLTTTLYATPGSSSFTSPVGTATTPTVFSSNELPYFYSGNDVRAFGFAAKPNSTQLNFNTYVSVGSSGGTYVVVDRGTPFTPTGTLDSSYPEVTLDVSTTNMVITTSSPDMMTFLIDQTADYIKTGRNLFMVNNEIMSFEDVQANVPSAGKYTLVNVWRGLLDTVPTAHASGSRVWFFSYGFSDPVTSYIDQNIYLKYTSIVGGGGESALSTSQNVATKRRGFKPYPPRYIRINSSTSTVNINAGSNIVLDWAHSNRIQQAQTVYKQFDNTITAPEQGTEYYIKFFNASNTLLRTVGPLSTLTYTYLNTDQVADNAGVEPLVVTYQIYSKREGLFSYYAQQRTLLRPGGSAPSPPAYSPGADAYDPINPGSASSIQETPVSGTAPTNGQILVYNSTTGQYEPQTVAQPPFLDTNALIKGSADATKLFRFEVDGFSTGVTRVATPPNEDFTIVGLATAQTLTNKTITSSTNVLGRVTMTLTSDGTGDVYYRDSGGLLTRLAIGTNGQVLTVASGLPSWATPSGGGGSTFADNLFRIQDDGDATKQLAFECSGITTATTRTLTIPNFDGTIATLAGTETFTNKTLTSPKINVTSDATGDLYYRDSGGNFVRLAIGSAGQVLTVSSGLPSWAASGGGSSPPFDDGTAIIKGSADATKLLRIEVDGFTTATTRVLTAPNFDGTIATLAGTETLTNKTLTSPVINVTSDATADTYYRNSGGVFTRLPIGSNGQVLTVASGLPSWASLGTAAITVEEADGTPSYTGISVIRFDQADGFVVTNPSAGVARIDFTGGSGGDSTTTDTLANRPAAGNDGNLFFPTDTPYIQRDNGSVWQSWGPMGKFPNIVVPPAVSNWTWVNQGASTTATDVGAGIYFTEIQTGSGSNAYYRLLKKAAPSTPYTIIIGLQHYFPIVPPSGTFRFGFIGRQSSDGRLLLFGYSPSGNSQAIRVISAAPTGSAPNLNYADTTATNLGSTIIPEYIFLKYNDNGTNRIMSISRDFGQTWVQVLSESRTTTITVNEVGFGCLAESSTASLVGFTLFHWEES